MLLKAKIIGIGACGNKACIELMNAYPELANSIILINSTLKDIPVEYKDKAFELKPDLIITLAYGQIVPQGLLDIPSYGCLNLHGSLLPKYRGAAPIQYALINNDKVTGMTLMEMTKEMDAGRMYAKKEVVIDEEDNCTSLFNKMGEAAKELILEALPKYIDGELKGEEQDINLVSFCPTIKPEQERLDLNLTAQEIYGWIRG